MQQISTRAGVPAIFRSISSRIGSKNWGPISILLLACALRIGVWWVLPYRDVISDEGEYWAAAAWLAQGRGFSFFDNWIWTRPPVYIVFLAAHIRLFGITAMWAPRITQTILSLLLVCLVMLLAQKLSPPELRQRVTLIAGVAMACSYSFATFGYLLLSETLFCVLFILAFLVLLHWHSISQTTAYTSLSWKNRYQWIVLAGVLFGLTALTKAIVVLWFPCIALWLWWINRKSNSSRWSRPAILPIVVLLGSIALTILPWSFYSTLRWGQGDGIILVDTTGGYNFALGAQSGYLGRRDENSLHDLLCGGTVCDAAQALRQRRAYALGWEWFQKAPGQFVQKSIAELLDAIQLQSGGAERLLSGYTLGQVPLWHLLGLLIDDTLYVLALPLAIVGLMRRQATHGKGLVVMWLLYNVAISGLIFAINRFRQPLLPFLFIYAGCALAQWRFDWPNQRQRWGAWCVGLLCVLVLLPSYAYWPPAFGTERRSTVQDIFLGIRGLRLAQECREIQEILLRGDIHLARIRHDAATRQQARPCLALINARLLVAEGKVTGPGGALEFLAKAAPAKDPETAARILMVEGDILRMLQRTSEAKDRFVSRAVESMNDLEWAWENLSPVPTHRIDLGAGLDFGYIRGFYKREGVAEQPGNYRWSGPEASIRFPKAGTGRAQTLLLRVNGYTTNPQPTQITPQIGSIALAPMALVPEWQTISIHLPATPVGQDVEVTFSSPAFVEGPIGLAEYMRSANRSPLRFLGFQLDQAELIDRVEDNN